MALTMVSPLPAGAISTRRCGFKASSCNGFPSFLPKEVEKIKDPFARSLARRIERVPVEISFPNTCTVMSSCIKPRIQSKISPVVLLHSFDSSCLEWRCAHPLLEEAGFETWAVDVLGWGFSDLESRPSCSVPAKRHHLYQLWKSHIGKPITLVGPSLGAAAAIDFTVNHPEAVEKLVLINPSVYAKGTAHLAKLPCAVAYAGVSFLRSIPLRLYANMLAFDGISLATCYDWANVKQQVLIIYGECDRIVSNRLAVKLRCELSNAILRQVPDSGHLPHVEKPNAVVDLIEGFVRDGGC